MCGYPGSGKTTFSNLLVPAYKKLGRNLHIIRPSDWYTDEIDEMSHEERSKWQIACWEHALDKTTKFLTSKPIEDTILLDTCGASPLSLRSNIATAKMNKHLLSAVWMAVSKNICGTRIDPNIVNKYAGKLKNAVLEYNREFDRLLIVRHGSVDDWKDIAAETASKLCQDDLVLQARTK